MALTVKTRGLERRRLRVKKKTKVSTRPRLVLKRSSRHIYAQILEPLTGNVLCASSTMSKDLRDAVKGLNKSDAAKKVGETIAALAKDKGLSEIVFDRSGYLYHGRVKALADGARESGLKF